MSGIMKDGILKSIFAAFRFTAAHPCCSVRPDEGSESSFSDTVDYVSANSSYYSVLDTTYTNSTSLPDTTSTLSFANETNIEDSTAHLCCNVRPFEGSTVGESSLYGTGDYVSSTTSSYYTALDTTTTPSNTPTLLQIVPTSDLSCMDKTKIGESTAARPNCSVSLSVSTNSSHYYSALDTTVLAAPGFIVRDETKIGSSIGIGSRRKSILRRSTRTSERKSIHAVNLKKFVAPPTISRRRVICKRPTPSRIPIPVNKNKGTNNNRIMAIKHTLGETVSFSILAPAATPTFKQSHIPKYQSTPVTHHNATNSASTSLSTVSPQGHKNGKFISPWSVVSVHPFRLRRRSSLHRAKKNNN